MAINSTLDKYRAHLVIGILSVRSVHKAKKMLDKAVKTLQEQNVAKETLQSILDKIISQLEKIREFSTDKSKLAMLLSAIVIITEMKAKL